jgi:predicted amidohydrolase
MELNLSDKTLYLNELDSSLRYIKKNILTQNEKEDIPFIKQVKLGKGYKYYPYLITMQDITKTLFFNNALFADILKEDMEDSKLKISSSSMIEKLYYCINYMKKYNTDNYENLVKTIQYSCTDSICEPMSNHYKNKNYNIIKIGNGNKDEINIAIATAVVEENNFIGVLMEEPNRSLKRYNALAEIVKQAVINKADILILPENYVPFEWLYLLEREAKKNNLAIITGVEHIKVEDNVYNLIASIFPYDYGDYKFVYTNLRTKVFYSPEEKRQITGYSYNFMEGEELNLFVWNNIWIPVYCCFEIASIKDRSYFSSLADLFTIVEWNKDINYFSNIIESLSRDMHCYCAQVNSANYGDSCLIRPSKSYKQTILRTKGGINSSILVDKINIKKLRRFQVKEYELQKDDKDFKPTPPNFNNHNAFLKDKNKLFEELMNNN